MYSPTLIIGLGTRGVVRYLKAKLKESLMAKLVLAIGVGGFGKAIVTLLKEPLEETYSQEPSEESCHLLRKSPDVYSEPVFPFQKQAVSKSSPISSCAVRSSVKASTLLLVKKKNEDENISKEQENFLIEFGDILAKRIGHQSFDATSEEKFDDQAALGLARYLRAARLNAGWTPAELAIKASVSEAEVYALERGLIYSKEIKVESLYGLAEALGEDVCLFDLMLERDIRVAAIEEKQPKAEVQSPHLPTALAFQSAIP